MQRFTLGCEVPVFPAECPFKSLKNRHRNRPEPAAASVSRHGAALPPRTRTYLRNFRRFLMTVQAVIVKRLQE
jgi:hypothetical protein